VTVVCGNNGEVRAFRAFSRHVQRSRENAVNMKGSLTMAKIGKIQRSILFKYKEDRLRGNNGVVALVKKKNLKLLHHCREIAWGVGRLSLIFS